MSHNSNRSRDTVYRGPATVSIIDRSDRVSTIVCRDITIDVVAPTFGNGGYSGQTFEISAVGTESPDATPIARMDALAADLDAFLSDVQEEDIDDVTRACAEDLRTKLKYRINPARVGSEEYRLNEHPYHMPTVPSSDFLDSLLFGKTLYTSATKSPDGKATRAKKVHDAMANGVVSVPADGGFVPAQVSQ